MAVTTGTVWEVRGGGSDSACGGGFDPSYGGTDYTLQAAAQATCPGTLSTSAAGATTLAATGSPFTATMVGNAIRIAAGTNFAAGFYTIVGYTDANTVALNASPTPSAAGSGGTGYVGGALAGPNLAISSMAGSNTLFIKYGATPYALTGQMSPPTGATAAPTLIVGYDATRTIVNEDVNRPTLATGGSYNALSVTNNHVRIRNLVVDGSVGTSSGGFFAAGTDDALSRCDAINCRNIGFTLSGNASARRCVAKPFSSGTGAVGFSVASATLSACVADGLSRAGTSWTGFALSGVAALDRCVARRVNGPGFKSTATAGPRMTNCVADDCSGDGLAITAAAGADGLSVRNCVLSRNGGYGVDFSVGGTLADADLDYNAYYANNGGGAPRNGVAAGANSIDLSAQPFLDPDSGDYRLNASSPGGAQLRGAGWPQALPTPLLSTTSYPDIGLAQHQDSGGGGSVGGPIGGGRLDGGLQ